MCNLELVEKINPKSSASVLINANHTIFVYEMIELQPD